MALREMSQNPAASHLNRLVAKIANVIWEWRDERASRKALGKLTDRELDDIGLLRSDIDQLTDAGQRNR